MAELWAEADTTGQGPPIAHFGLGDIPAQEVDVAVRRPDRAVSTARVPIDAQTTDTR